VRRRARVREGKSEEEGKCDHEGDGEGELERGEDEVGDNSFAHLCIYSITLHNWRNTQNSIDPLLFQYRSESIEKGKQILDH